MIFIIFCLFQTIICSTHWKVTEEGRIEIKDDSVFTLLRPYDLASFMKQNDRLNRINYLKEFIQSKELPINQKDPKAVSTYQEEFYKNDADCQKAEQHLTKFSFYETHLISWHSQGFFLPKESLDIKRSQVKLYKKPFCDIINLPFNMQTFDHLDSIQSKENITMLPETDLLANILFEPEDFYGHLIHVALLTNSSSWVYLAMAGDYFRIKGDYLNAIKCLQRSIYYAPRIHQTIPILSLSNMLHKLHFINDSLAIALSGATIDPQNSVFCYYIGNIYVTLGDLNSANEWYDRAVILNSNFRQAFLKKHAILCHIKLEQFLEDQHYNLQKKLEELKDYQTYSDEWFMLNSKIELEKSSLNRKEITQKLYNHMLHNTNSKVCWWHKEKLECKQLAIHYSFIPFNNQTIIDRIIQKDEEKYCEFKEYLHENFNLCQKKSKDKSKYSILSLQNQILTEKLFQSRIKPPSTRDFLISQFG